MGVGVGQSTLLTFSVYVVVHYFILGLNFIFFCFWVWEVFLPKITLGITGLHEIVDRDYSIVELY